MVIAVEFPMAELEPGPPPRAPSERVFRRGSWEIIAKRSALATWADVKDNFTSRGTLEVAISEDSLRMGVNDRSRRRRLGQSKTKEWREISDSEV
jgi:hypothetical protein